MEPSPWGSLGDHDMSSAQYGTCFGRKRTKVRSLVSGVPTTTLLQNLSGRIAVSGG